jgi:hypothetical protein
MKLDLSYSSINKMLFSPKLFYSHYILNEREEKIESYLVEGKLVHCFILQPEEFDNLFTVAPGKVPTSNVLKILHSLHAQVNGGSSNLEDHHDLILSELQSQNLYQSFKEDEKRLEKICTEDNQNYFTFLFNRQGKDLVDEDMVERCKAYAQVMRDEPSIAAHLELTTSDGYKVMNEIPLELKEYSGMFGLKGIIDRLVIDEFGNAEVIDVKTTGKTISDFADTIEFYNYWLQAAIYITLVNRIHNISIDKISYSFWVIDKYEQVYNFGVSKDTIAEWLNRFDEAYNKATYHIENVRYDVPYDFCKPDRIML